MNIEGICFDKEASLMADDNNLTCQIEDMGTMPVPRTCRAAFGTSSNLLGIDQDMPLQSRSMIAIICTALFLIWMG